MTDNPFIGPSLDDWLKESFSEPEQKVIKLRAACAIIEHKIDQYLHSNQYQEKQGLSSAKRKDRSIRFSRKRSYKGDRGMIELALTLFQFCVYLLSIYLVLVAFGLGLGTAAAIIIWVFKKFNIEGF